MPSSRTQQQFQRYRPGSLKFGRLGQIDVGGNNGHHGSKLRVMEGRKTLRIATLRLSIWEITVFVFNRSLQSGEIRSFYCFTKYFCSSEEIYRLNYYDHIYSG
jgi:hypothetical protein